MNNKLLVSDSNLKLTDNDIINGYMMVSNSTSFLPLHIGFQVMILTIVFSTGFELNKTGVLAHKQTLAHYTLIQIYV